MLRVEVAVRNLRLSSLRSAGSTHMAAMPSIISTSALAPLAKAVPRAIPERSGAKSGQAMKANHSGSTKGSKAKHRGAAHQ